MSEIAIKCAKNISIHDNACASNKSTLFLNRISAILLEAHAQVSTIDRTHCTFVNSCNTPLQKSHDHKQHYPSTQSLH